MMTWMTTGHVTVGHVAQLTVDLVICTLDMRRIGYIEHPGIVPVIVFDQLGGSTPQLLTSADGSSTCRRVS